jgi:hypothetical protein
MREATTILKPIATFEKKNTSWPTKQHGGDERQKDPERSAKGQSLQEERVQNTIKRGYREKEKERVK